MSTETTGHSFDSASMFMPSPPRFDHDDFIVSVLKRIEHDAEHQAVNELWKAEATIRATAAAVGLDIGPISAEQRAEAIRVAKDAARMRLAVALAEMANPKDQK